MMTTKNKPKVITNYEVIYNICSHKFVPEDISQRFSFCAVHLLFYISKLTRNVLLTYSTMTYIYNE